MATRADVTEGKTRVSATTDLTTVAPTGPNGSGGVLVSAVVAMSLGALLLTPVGMQVCDRLLHILANGRLVDLSALPVPLAAIGVGLALVMVFLAQAYRRKHVEAPTAVQTPAPTVTGPSSRASAESEPVEWLGEVKNVSTLTRGSLELYGNELVSDLLGIDNISPLKVRKLEGIGILSRADLLRIGRSQLGRQDIARRTGIGVRQLTDWLNKADLMRIPGLTMPMIRLLEVAGIETIEDLAVARPEAIERKLAEFSKRQTPGTALPGAGELSAWVAAAGELVN